MAGVFALLLARPVIPGLVLVLVTLLALWQTTQIRVAVDLSGLIGNQTQGAQAMTRYSERFAPFRAEEVLLVRAPSFASEEALDALEDLVLELQFVDGVAQVISLPGLPAPGRTGAWLTGPELADLPPGERLRQMRTESPLAAQMIAESLDATLISVAAERGALGDAFAERVMAAADSVPGLDVTPVGLLEVQRAIAVELIHDLGVLVPAAVLICLLISGVLFRSLRAVAVISLPPIAGLVWFLGFLGATGTPIDPLMGALPVVLIVLAFSDSIHVYHAAIGALTTDTPRATALARALAQTAPAAAFTSLTTLIAFASLALPDSPSLNAMAWTGGVGMVLCLAAVLAMTPVLMWALGVPRRGTQAPGLFARVVPPALALARHGRVVVVLAVLVLGGVWALQSRSEVGFRYADYLPQGAPVTEALAMMDDSGLGSDRMLVVIEADPDAPLDRVRRAAAAIYGPGASGFTEGETGARMLDRMAARDGSAHALPVQMPIAASDIRADEALSALEARLAEAGLAGASHVVGPGYALLVEGPRIVESLRFGLYATILSITLLVALVYRSIRLALVGLVVNLIPIMGVEAWLVLLGREVTIMNMIALTVAFGIAIDDTLHFLNRFRLARGETADRVTQAVREAGPPMAATTLILLAGLVVTLASSLPGLSIFGGLIALAVGLALVADLFLLPGLIRWSMK
ncbi:MMPL family transporter [Rhodobacter sp. NTK016B]|uniref:efflux RND transporter permease subunit n=1 Tax=Rhodobacter sp. NTK016B TaxID=2759676 RepID=UPI001A8F4445|nr:MMPL family transporter [Rhodobacter sp. NTK016B]MBN8293136.1 MMPL family transporter [Rhodobacter sp. NTK016B]